jgi:hypothetical protein
MQHTSECKGARDEEVRTFDFSPSACYANATKNQEESAKDVCSDLKSC